MCPQKLRALRQLVNQCVRQVSTAVSGRRGFDRLPLKPGSHYVSFALVASPLAHAAETHGGRAPPVRPAGSSGRRAGGRHGVALCMPAKRLGLLAVPCEVRSAGEW